MLKQPITELQKANNIILSTCNKERQMYYRKYAKIVKDIFDFAKGILDEFLEPDYALPIDIYTLAKKLNFVISIEDFKEIENNFFNDGHNCIPTTQLTMRKQHFGKDSDKLCGTIHIADYLNANSTRFSIAKQLGYFALRTQSRIGSFLKFEASSGLYPLLDTEDMLTNVFAYALLLPYHLFEQARISYESDRTHWPLDYSRWIAYLRDKAQMPEYHVVLANQEIKKVSICLKYEIAKEKLYERLRLFGISDAEDQQASLALYAITVNNLEAWGYSQNEIAAILFKNPETEQKRSSKDINNSIIEYLHDFYLNSINSDTLKHGYPQELLTQIASILHDEFGISDEGISKIISFETGKKLIINRIDTI